MQMITKNHLEYINNELMNMDPNTYSHYEIYEWYNRYLDQRFFTESDFSDFDRLERLKEKGHNSILKPNERILSDEFYHFKWEDRYSTLNQKTTFFRNLMVFYKLFWSSWSINEYRIKLALNGLMEECSNFWVVWLYNKPGYEFSYDWKLDENKLCGNNSYKYDKELLKFKMLEKLYHEIEYNNKPMVTYDEFVKEELSK